MAVKILVVDDSATMRKILEMTFAGENAEVMTIDNADAAIQKAGELSPKVVFADASMQGTDGYAVAKAVKSNPALAETAVIIMASQHTAYDESRGRAAGVDDHVLKPFDTQALIDKVQEVLSRPRVRLAAMAPAAATTVVTTPVTTQPVASPPAGPSSPSGMSRPISGPPAAVMNLARKNTVAFGSPAMPQAPNPSSLGKAPVRPPRPVLELAEETMVESDRSVEAVRPIPPARPIEAARPVEPAQPAAPVRPIEPVRPAAPARPNEPAAASHARMAQPTSSAKPTVQVRPASTLIDTRPSIDTTATTAAVSSANGQMIERLTNLGLTKNQIEGVLALSKEIIEQVVWEVVPELAETLIKEEIRRLTAE